MRSDYCRHPFAVLDVLKILRKCPIDHPGADGGHVPLEVEQEPLAVPSQEKRHHIVFSVGGGNQRIAALPRPPARWDKDWWGQSMARGMSQSWDCVGTLYFAQNRKMGAGTCRRSLPWA